MLYKRFIRQKISDRRKNNGTLTHAQLSMDLHIEPSYLSRFLSDDRVHFSDELVLRMMRILAVSEEQVDTLWLLREFDRCNDPARRSYLASRIRLNRIPRWTLELKAMGDELAKVLHLVKQASEASGHSEPMDPLDPVPDLSQQGNA